MTEISQEALNLAARLAYESGGGEPWHQINEADREDHRDSIREALADRHTKEALPAIQAQVLAEVREPIENAMSSMTQAVMDIDKGKANRDSCQMLEASWKELKDLLATLNPSEQGDSDEPADK